MDLIIWSFLAQEGVVNGSIYGLNALALVLVFSITRVIFFPQGDIAVFSALTFIALSNGRVPETIYLLMLIGMISTASEVIARWREIRPVWLLPLLAIDIGYPLALLALVTVLAPLKLHALAAGFLTLAMVVPLGPALYRAVFKPMAAASVLALLCLGMAVHLMLIGFALYFFGPDGQRGPALIELTLRLGDLPVGGQAILTVVVMAVVLAALWLLLNGTLYGKALQASAVNLIGARLVGIPTAFSGQIAFGLAALVGGISGILMSPTSTLYYDSGLILTLKAFVAAILGGLASIPIAVASALMIATIESFASFWASAFKEVIVFAFLLPALLWLSASGPRHEHEAQS